MTLAEKAKRVGAVIWEVTKDRYDEIISREKRLKESSDWREQLSFAYDTIYHHKNYKQGDLTQDGTVDSIPHYAHEDGKYYLGLRDEL